MPKFQTLGLVAAIGCAVVTLPARPAAAQSAAAVARYPTTSVVVEVPTDGAELVVNGSPVAGAGTSRTFETASLTPGTHKYTFAVTWDPNGYTKITRTKTVELRAGEKVRVDLTVEDPGDRIRVIYVPTPPDIAQKMVEMASVTPKDVIYEPGCGDARITIAAIRAGARRGVCVDIDPERARESKANVQAAGFADRIDVREGDALDVKQLSDVTVVLLYMGEHFNMLIRPVLWRELPVGARVVSHRFDMGDWKSDESIAQPGEDGISYDLHVWTITKEIKERARQAAQQSTPAFEVASVKPLKPGSENGGGGFFPDGRFAVTGTTVRELIRLAYGIADYQLLGGPNWLTTERFAVDARARTVAGGAVPSREDVRLMLQSLLAQRFKLAVTRETRELPMFSLEIARADQTLGKQLRRSTIDCSTAASREHARKTLPPDRQPCATHMASGVLLGNGTAFTTLLSLLSLPLGSPIDNRTGLDGAFDWELRWVTDPAKDGPPLMVAVEEQLGLKLRPTRAPVSVLVIESVDRPTPD